MYEAGFPTGHMQGFSHQHPDILAIGSSTKPDIHHFNLGKCSISDSFQISWIVVVFWMWLVWSAGGTGETGNLFWELWACQQPQTEKENIAKKYRLQDLNSDIQIICCSFSKTATTHTSIKRPTKQTIPYRTPPINTKTYLKKPRPTTNNLEYQGCWSPTP